MKRRLSVIMTTLNSQDILSDSLKSVRALAAEIIIVDSGSTDATKKIALQYGARFVSVKKNHLGKNKAKALALARCPWVLLLDSDEIISTKLSKEMHSVISKKSPHEGYFLPFKNHYLGHPLRYGGENYKMLRLFKRNKGRIRPVAVHEYVVLKSDKIKTLKNPILHYSYRSIGQMYKKFTTYALDESKEKYSAGEKSSFRKVFLHPVHMFWARYVEDKGYQDGLFRIPLDLGFSYMEFLTYLTLAFKKK